MSVKSFREDINGLRAIAVVSVFIFHFSHDWLPGGFAGVDVFFVISGFLMTSIIFRGLENKSFSFTKFFQARANRIIPALLATIIATLIFGYLFIDPLSYKALGLHAASSLSFVSNIIYSSEAGYFDTEAYDKILLHTWSLSTEWQFYIAYPLILIALSKLFNLSSLKRIVLVSTVLFFLISLYTTSTKPTAAYYLLYSRAWEMLLGGVAFLYPLGKKYNLGKPLEALGLILIIISFFIISDKTPWPGHMALLPTLGAYLCILANNNKTFLSGFIIQKLGLLSYSIYLVHWVIITLSIKLSLEIPFVYYLCLTLILSYAIYELIEKRRSYGYKLMTVFITTILLSLYIFKDGLSFRVSKDYQLNAKEYHSKYYGGAGFKSDGSIQYINDKNNPDFILVGDSHSRHYANTIKNNGINGIGIFADGCFSSENYYNSRTGKYQEYCLNRYDSLIKTINTYKKTDVIIAQRWLSHQALTSKTTGERISNKDLKIIKAEIDLLVKSQPERNYYIIGMVQGTKEVTYECLAKNQLPLPKLLNNNCPSTQDYKSTRENKILEDWTKKHRNMFFINPNDFLCKNKRCLVLDNKNQPIYSDRGHLSKYGSDIVLPELIKSIRRSSNISLK